ncbi:hypothetical protein [Bdellovibrio sp. ArHS]|uniref:hypothetical protein n=1 Tax=Bdellovibrio sp. ArHS TaxID=1569284 RepID=UPI000A40DCEE|nr:hypothetical protein [Bdellovibrio sp. ArHS]
MKQNVEICSGCVVRSSQQTEESTFLIKKKFLEELNARLRELCPEVEWNVSFTPCMRFCPEGKISLVVKNQMGMSGGTDIDIVARNIIARGTLN